MKTTQILKSILIPTLGISAIGAITTVSTSCGQTHVVDTSLDKDSTSAMSAESIANYGDTTASPYVVIIANKGSTLQLKNYGENNPDFKYSIDGGINWHSFGPTISWTMHINQGQTLYLKGNNRRGLSRSYDIYSTISITGNVSLSGNIMGLLDNGAQSWESSNITDIPHSCCFYKLFEGSKGITSVSENFLPATELYYHCYEDMFRDCSSLTKAPELPAKTLWSGCYASMFAGCASLVTAPELPATSLATDCYRYMFHSCTSLATAPKLPAIILADSCYYGMFNECTSLTTAPELPATTLTNGCYYSMFEKCTSLTTAPNLPATVLVKSCYDWMFANCTSLNSIKIGYTGDYNHMYFMEWVHGVPASGIFYYKGTTQTAQNFKLPSGWRKASF